MATVLRPELSKKNKYYIDKHRHYELKHFCLQYPDWKKEYDSCRNVGPHITSFEELYSTGKPSDPTFSWVARRESLREKIKKPIRLKSGSNICFLKCSGKKYSI